GLLPQAGLALALAALFVKTFPGFGAEARALVLGVVALNELIAPAIYRWALVRSGEAGQREVAETADRPAEQPAACGRGLPRSAGDGGGPLPAVDGGGVGVLPGGRQNPGVDRL